MNQQEEAAYMQGRKAVLTRLLQQCASEIGYDDPVALATKWIAEREAAIASLRDLCEEFGDNEWPDNMHLSDIIDKHLGRHLYAASEEEQP